MKNRKTVQIFTALCVSAAILSGTALSSAAASSISPEFAYDEEKWASLRDNVMDYSEIADLIHEYNATVINNRISYDDYRGKSREDISRDYQDAATQLEQNAVYPDDGNPSYALLYMAAVTSDIQADSMLKMADNNVNDGAIVKLQYEQVEDTLVSNAQMMMNSYNQLLLQLDVLKKNRELVQASADSAEHRAAAGIATQVDVLNARQSVQTLDANIATVETNISQMRQNLCVMMGWDYNAMPDIQQIPSSDMERITRMDPAIDKDAAIENNYTVKVNQRQLLNSSNQYTISGLKKTIEDNKQKIASALNAQYQAVLLAKTSYDQAAAELALEERTMQTVERQYKVGTATKLEYLSEQAAYLEKQMNVRTADMKLFQEMETYDWDVKGLASAS